MEEKEWKKKLTKEQYRILREKGTEMPFTGELLHNKEKGAYVCAACGNELFSSKDKFDSGSGWPSFWDANPEAVELKDDYSHAMHRIEVNCKKCGGHLGHMFGELPHERGGKKYYCINSVSLNFKKKKKD